MDSKCKYCGGISGYMITTRIIRQESFNWPTEKKDGDLCFDVSGTIQPKTEPIKSCLDCGHIL